MKVFSEGINVGGFSGRKEMCKNVYLCLCLKNVFMFKCVLCLHTHYIFCPHSTKNTYGGYTDTERAVM